MWFVVVVVRVGGILSHGVTDDAVEQVVGNVFYHGGRRWWVEEGYVVVWFGWAWVGLGLPVE